MSLCELAMDSQFNWACDEEGEAAMRDFEAEEARAPVVSALGSVAAAMPTRVLWHPAVATAPGPDLISHAPPASWQHKAELKPTFAP